MSKFKELAEAILNGKAKDAEIFTKQMINEGFDPGEILAEGMIATMGVVGAKFSSGEIYIPEMLVAARAMKKGIEVLKPYMQGDNRVSLGKCIIGTVEGDMHDIGKNIVSIMLEGNGFEVIDLGVDIKNEQFIETVKANPDIKIVALSCLLTTAMPAMESCVHALRASELKGLKILIGGAPITQEFADMIGADAYCEDAASGAAVAKTLVS